MIINQKILDWLNQYPDLGKIRPNWDEWFLMYAFIASRRSSCWRHKVGAVIVKEKDIISSGYNGSPTYQHNCLEIGSCYRNEHNIHSGMNLELCRASGCHAESNAIAMASKNGNATLGTTIYIVGHYQICNDCKGHIANAGIVRVVHLKEDGTIEETDPRKKWIKSPIDTDQDLLDKMLL